MVKRNSRKRKRRKANKRQVRKPSFFTVAFIKYIIRNNWKKLFIVLIVIFLSYCIVLNFIIQNQFEGKRWSLPAHVFARPLELYVGKKLTTINFDTELQMLFYRNSIKPKQAGTYNKKANVYRIFTRKFSFWDGNESARIIEVEIKNKKIIKLINISNQSNISLLRLDPVFIGGIYPSHFEDRLLIQMADVPNLLHSTLILIEDRKFYNHYGIDPASILRALWANIRAGRTVQGGSTLTQQLVKNFFLTNKRTLWRKANEALMALMLEFKYDKNDIIQAYMNEIYIGQQGKRAIHGFGLASQFYFDKSINDLKLPEIALLVAMIKGPQYYNPYRHPKRAKQRRDRILNLMAKNNLISKANAKYAKASNLGIVYSHASGISKFPAFLDLVKRQLRSNYNERDLKSEGLQIFTTLDPIIQANAESIVADQLKKLQHRVPSAAKLQSAVVVTSSISAEVLALVGDRKAGFAGFNRALDANRSIGSLVKPAVYLAALIDSDQYNLISPISDAAVTLQAQNGNTWTPKNYDGVAHGIIPLYEGLSKSYNQATVRLGMTIGLRSVISTLIKLGIKQEIKPYPSLMLGSISMSPFDATTMYQTIASGGFQSPLRAIREVLTSNQQPLRRYSIQVEQTIANRNLTILHSALQQVVTTGTGRAVNRWLESELNVAGKTGTTNNLRDSWFAGFSAKHLAVVWVGTDDNVSTGLTGASGALPIWARLFKTLDTSSLDNINTDEVEYLNIDPNTLLLNNRGCKLNVKLAFIKGSGPQGSSNCNNANNNSVVDRSLDWFKGIFN